MATDAVAREQGVKTKKRSRTVDVLCRRSRMRGRISSGGAQKFPQPRSLGPLSKREDPGNEVEVPSGTSVSREGLTPD